MARRGRPPAEDHKHGTHGGVIMHRKRGTPVCGWCLRGDALFRWRQRNRGKCSPGLGWPVLSAREAG